MLSTQLSLCFQDVLTVKMNQPPPHIIINICVVNFINSYFY